jgi:hypothetical protein
MLQSGLDATFTIVNYLNTLLLATSAALVQPQICHFTISCRKIRFTTNYVQCWLISLILGL